MSRILVFIPAYNCAPQITRVLRQLDSPEVQEVIDGVVVVDNRSPDTTRQAAAEGLAKLPLDTALLHNDDNYGLGGSHKVAINYAREQGYDFLIVLHGDDQGDIADIVPHLKASKQLDLDFFMGARFMKGSRLEGYSTLRTAANEVFNLIFSFISGRRLYDLGSGLNLFRVSAFDGDWHLKYADDLTFNYYLILGVVRRGCRLRFFPLTWREDDQVSNAKLSRMGIQLLRIILFRMYRPKAFFANDHRATARDAYPSTRVV
ncbi:glycosyltransferase family 2 protein [Tropicibacter naphthalenivorans]|uniref:Glycosyltransferase n=1 Tax=Tropicibacter naphthalenivorans TaxID=441103 RepID=A0A0N7M049_9RHOB|nr:glycosyltransferase family 2 protein [Tropicibacter naphthalenivorans]CUH79473.1 glycosyltransferase [Tropicibacter naphthalenivorans]SMC72804.1 Glycosyl transferase family 2 [Tropicibacter naphthalenivorans]